MQERDDVPVELQVWDYEGGALVPDPEAGVELAPDVPRAVWAAVLNGGEAPSPETQD